MLFAQPLERLVLSDLHTCAHVAVAVHEEGESARQVFAAWWKRLWIQFTLFKRDSIPFSPTTKNYGFTLNFSKV